MLLPTIESPLAVVNIRYICEAAGPRLLGLTFGADDYASSMGIERSVEESEFRYVRDCIVW